jgi:hypothetical protein
VFVPLGEFEEGDSPVLIIDIVEHSVGSNSQAIRGGELCHNELSGEFFCLFPLRSRIPRTRPDGGGDGCLGVGWDFGQCFLE